MNADIKTKWVASLRSGQYKPGRDELRTPMQDGTFCYCPLGVLVDIARIEGEEWAEASLRCGHVLGPAALAWSGLKDSEPSLRLSTFVLLEARHLHSHYITAMNDDGNYTFAQIADLIEEQL